MSENTKSATHQVVIVGGGAGGLSVASVLLKQRPSLDIAVIDPSEFHYYQPAWTLVGGGAFDAKATQHTQASCMPKTAHWIKHRVVSFEPENNQVTLDDGSHVGYKFMVVAAGIQLDWNKIEGLEATLGKNGVTSNYRYDLAPYTWECVRTFSGGRAVFTYPATPIKCAGAPQKILYLAADSFRSRAVKADIHYCTAGGAVFGVPFYNAALEKVMSAYGAHVDLKHNLVAIDGPARKATFEVGPDKQRTVVEFDMIHVVPPQSAPDFIKSSPLANEGGWVAVDKNSLRHDKYANIFALGDCCSAPNSKTAAAVRAQARVVVANLLAAIDNAPLSGSYDGYASCPVTTSKGKVMLCEFLYGGAVTSSFRPDPRIPRRRYWWLKKFYFPRLYWGMVSGRLGPDWHAARHYSESVPTITP